MGVDIFAIGYNKTLPNKNTVHIATYYECDLFLCAIYIAGNINMCQPTASLSKHQRGIKSIGNPYV